MDGYLGDTKINWKEHPEFKDMTQQDWALRIAYHYAQTDGSHHKAWVIDQMVRILNGAEIKVVQAEWDDGYTEIRWTVGTSDEYQKWVKKYEMEDGDPNAYEWDTGISP